MGRISIILAFALSGTAIGVRAQPDPPDYLWFMEEADDLPILGTSRLSCKHAGVIIDEEETKAAMNRLLVAGVKDGIDSRTAMRLVDQAFQSESRDMEFLASQVDKDDPASVDDFAQFWVDRCFALAYNPKHAGIVAFDETLGN